MISIVRIPRNGGHRKFYNLEGKVVKVSHKKPWYNLFRKTQVYHIEASTAPMVSNQFKNAVGKIITMPSILKIKINDVAKLLQTKQDDTVSIKIGYADQNQQYYYGVNMFSLEVNGKELHTNALGV